MLPACFSTHGELPPEVRGVTGRQQTTKNLVLFVRLPHVISGLMQIYICCHTLKGCERNAYPPGN